MSRAKGKLNTCNFVCGTVSRAKLSLYWSVTYYRGPSLYSQDAEPEKMQLYCPGDSKGISFQI